jgi:hypothetical protein
VPASVLDWVHAIVKRSTCTGIPGPEPEARTPRIRPSTRRGAPVTTPAFERYRQASRRLRASFRRSLRSSLRRKQTLALPPDPAQPTVDHASRVFAEISRVFWWRWFARAGRGDVDDSVPLPRCIVPHTLGMLSSVFRRRCCTSQTYMFRNILHRGILASSGSSESEHSQSYVLQRLEVM